MIPLNTYLRYLAFACCIAATTGIHATTLIGRVVGVTDGDTLTLLDTSYQQHKIRLSGIDAPEKKQPFGARSKANLGALAFNREATAECPKKDRYGRWVCVLHVRGQDIGLAQISAGMAWWYQQYAREQTLQARIDYEQAELSAKEGRQGLWNEKSPTPPWEWRQARRNH